MTVENLTTEQFRQRLAGLIDPAAQEDLHPDDYGYLAARFVLLLAIAFNRKQLQAKTIWARIESAIDRALADCDGDDLNRLMSSALEHVKANINVVVSEETCLAIQSELKSLPKEARVYFCRYLSDHRYPAIVMGRELWEQRKSDLEAKTDQLYIAFERDEA